jgi:hypothetical protein
MPNPIEQEIQRKLDIFVLTRTSLLEHASLLLAGLKQNLGEGANLTLVTESTAGVWALPDAGTPWTFDGKNLRFGVRMELWYEAKPVGFMILPVTFEKVNESAIKAVFGIESSGVEGNVGNDTTITQAAAERMLAAAEKWTPIATSGIEIIAVS